MAPGGRRLLAGLLAGMILGCVPLAAAATPLSSEIATLAEQTDGTVGVAVRRVAGGAIATLNPDQTFPMASTFKIAVAGAIFAKVDHRELSLDRMIAVDPATYVSSDGIAQYLPHAGVVLSLHNLLELMLTRSDNTATDVLIALAGGPSAVNAWLNAQGIKGQRVDGDTGQLILRAFGIAPGRGTFRQQLDAALAAHRSVRDYDEKHTPNAAFNADARDTTTPAAMLELLLRIRAGKALSPASTRELLAIMARCQTGERRLKGLLPPGTSVAHKTGTLNSIANDVGVITLPDGSQYAIAVYVKGDTRGIDVQERVIAEISRAAYEHYRLGGS